MRGCVIGVDVGTTGTKSILFSLEGQALGRAYRRYATAAPAPGASLQNGEDWWNALTETVREVGAALPTGQEVLALALSVQGGTLIPTDRGFCPVGPGIVWNDTRAGAARRAFACRFPEELL